MAAEIIGYVLDNKKRPVGNVKISFKGKLIAKTKDDGFFSVTLEKKRERAALTFIKDGYVTNTKVFNPVCRGKNIIIIWPIAYQCRFNPTRDLDIELGGSRIQIPANALEAIDAKEMKDSALLQYTWFDVTDPFQRRAASGNFTGKMRDGKIVRLNSNGIFDLELLDRRNRSLKLRREAKIDLSIPLPRKLIEQAPKKTGFFSFDTLTGMWNEIGSFQFIPETLTYNGSITRFGGAYNLDDPQETTCITLQVVYLFNLMPMLNFHVWVDGLQYYSDGWTDNNGFVCLLVQRNASFTATAYGSVGLSEYGTPYPPTFTSPDISSNEDNCGDPALCPFLGTVEVDVIVGI